MLCSVYFPDPTPSITSPSASKLSESSSSVIAQFIPTSPVLPYIDCLEEIKQNANEGKKSSPEHDSTQQDTRPSPKTKATSPNTGTETSTGLESDTPTESFPPGGPQSQSSPVFEPIGRTLATLVTSNQPDKDIKSQSEEVEQNEDPLVVLTCDGDIPHTECQVTFTPPSTTPPSPAQSASPGRSVSPLIDPPSPAHSVSPSRSVSSLIDMADDFKDDESFGAPTIDTDCLYSQAESDTLSAFPESGQETPHRELITPDSGHVTAQETDMENIGQENITTADEGFTDDNVEEVNKETEDPMQHADPHTESEVVQRQGDDVPPCPIDHHDGTAVTAANASDDQMNDGDTETDQNKRAETIAMSQDTPLADVESAFDLQGDKSEEINSGEEDDLIVVSQTNKRKIDLEALMSGDRNSEDDFEAPSFVVNSPLRKKTKTSDSPLKDKLKRIKKGGKAKRSLDTSSLSQASESGTDGGKSKSKKKKKKQKFDEDDGKPSQGVREQSDPSAGKHYDSESDEQMSIVKPGKDRIQNSQHRKEAEADQGTVKNRYRKNRDFGASKTKPHASTTADVSSDSESVSEDEVNHRELGKKTSQSKARTQKPFPPMNSDTEQESDEQEKVPRSKADKKIIPARVRKDRTDDKIRKRKKKSVSSDSEDSSKPRKAKAKKKKRKKQKVAVPQMTFPSSSESESEESRPQYKPKRKRTQSNTDDNDDISMEHNSYVEAKQDGPEGSGSEQDIFDDEASESDGAGPPQITASQPSEG